MAANQLTSQGGSASPYGTNDMTKNAWTNSAHGSIVGCYDEGGMIPGKAQVPGDSEQNDKVPILASAGEAVIPRTQVAQHFPQVLSMLSGHNEQPQTDPQDVATTIKALRLIRMGAA
jgi:hypothetical protein